MEPSSRSPPLPGGPSLEPILPELPSVDPAITRGCLDPDSVPILKRCLTDCIRFLDSKAETTILRGRTTYERLLIHKLCNFFGLESRPMARRSEAIAVSRPESLTEDLAKTREAQLASMVAFLASSVGPGQVDATAATTAPPSDPSSDPPLPALRLSIPSAGAQGGAGPALMRQAKQAGAGAAPSPLAASVGATPAYGSLSSSPMGMASTPQPGAVRLGMSLGGGNGPARQPAAPARHSDSAAAGAALQEAYQAAYQAAVARQAQAQAQAQLQAFMQVDTLNMFSQAQAQMAGMFDGMGDLRGGTPAALGGSSAPPLSSWPDMPSISPLQSPLSLDFEALCLSTQSQPGSHARTLNFSHLLAAGLAGYGPYAPPLSPSLHMPSPRPHSAQVGYNQNHGLPLRPFGGDWGVTGVTSSLNIGFTGQGPYQGGGGGGFPGAGMQMPGGGGGGGNGGGGGAAHNGMMGYGYGPLPPT